MHPEIVPAIALNVFAGLRPEAEGFRGDWRFIDLERGEIDIDPEHSKNTMSDRFIKMEPNLIAWLKPYAQAAGSLGPKNEAYWDRLRKVRAAAGIADWPQDGLRHTFASMHLAQFKNRHLTAEQLGHGGSIEMLRKKYRHKLRDEEPAKFWNIFPTLKETKAAQKKALADLAKQPIRFKVEST